MIRNYFIDQHKSFNNLKKTSPGAPNSVEAWALATVWAHVFHISNANQSHAHIFTLACSELKPKLICCI